MRERTIALAAVALLAASLLAGTGAATLTERGGQSSLAIGAQETETANESATDANVSAGTGAKLSTVITSASGDVRTEYEETSFEASFEGGNDTERAEAIAERASELDARASAIQAEYENTTRAYENGTISREEYAQRVAALNARADNVYESTERLDRRADDVSRTELRTAGLNSTEFNRTLETLDAISGPSHDALLAKFTGESEAEIEIRSGDGVRIEVESEDGERSREFRQPGDHSTAITIDQSVARENARSNLSTGAGSWALSEASIHEEDGEYRFEFRLSNGTERGEAEVRVDGSSGTVVRVEEELERPESDEDEVDVEDGELTVVVTDGTVAPNETVSVLVRAGDQPVAGVPVTLDGARVGETDENGTVDVALPEGDDARIEADDGGRDGRLDLEFDDGDDRLRSPAALSSDATYDDGTITVTVTNDGDPVDGTTVELDGDRVGTTDANGTLSFDVDPNADDYEVDIEAGDAEIEATYVLRDGSLVTADDADGSETETESETESENEAESGTETATPSADDVGVEAALEDGTVTLTLTTEGSPVSGATLSVNSDTVGTTDADGVVTFQVEADEEDYDVRFENDGTEIRTEYLVENGTVERTEPVQVD